jgi:hypothetical protein
MEHFIAMAGTVLGVALLLAFYGIDWRKKK